MPGYWTGRLQPNTTSAGESGSSGVAADALHSHPATPVPGWPWFGTGQTSGSLEGSSVMPDTAKGYIMPFPMPFPLTLAKATIRVTTAAAGGLVGAGLYHVDGHLVADLGTFSTASVGLVTNTFATVREVQVGAYWLLFLRNTSAATAAVTSWPTALANRHVGNVSITAGTLPDVFDPEGMLADGGIRPYIHLAAF